MASEDLLLNSRKSKSFSIDSILKMENKEIIKIPNLTCILDGQTVYSEPLVTDTNEVKCEKALDLSVNISNVEDEGLRKSLKDHAQINNVNGLYTNSVLSDQQHLAKAKSKQCFSNVKAATLQTIMERETIELGDVEQKAQCSEEEKNGHDMSCNNADKIFDISNNSNDSRIGTGNLNFQTNEVSFSTEPSEDDDMTAIEEDEEYVEEPTPAAKETDFKSEHHVEEKKTGLQF